MKIYTNDQIRAIDAGTIRREGIAGIELVERAAEGIARKLWPVGVPTKELWYLQALGTTVQMPWPPPVSLWSRPTCLKYTCSTSAATDCIQIAAKAETVSWLPEDPSLQKS